MSELETFNALKDDEVDKKKFFSNWPPFLIFLFDLIKLVVLAFIIVWPIHYFIFQPFYVVGPSMEPNFYNQEYLIIEKISYRFNDPQRGEVIIFRSLANHKDYLIKRIIALPLERVVIKGGIIYIYNDLFPQGLTLNEEKYLFPGTTTPGDIDVELLSDQYYVLGDNRNMSLDSRVFGPIKQEDITGRAWFKGWPFKNMGLIKMTIFTY